MDPALEKQERASLEPEDLSSLLGNLIISHRAGMSYEDTKKKLAGRVMDRSTSGFTNIHHSFWEVLKEDLTRNPSDMGLAANLLLDIKSRVLSLLTPTTRGLQVEVERLLDDEIIQAKSGKGPIRLKACGNGILHILERICIPHREEEIRKLVKEKNLLALYKGIISITDKMVIDQRRYSKSTRITVPAEDSDDESVDKVADYMYHLGGELPVTEAWLQKYFDQKCHTRDVMCNAFVGLLASGPEQYPETLMMHIPRIEALKKEYFQLIIAVSVVLTSLAYLPPEMCTMDSRENCFTMAMILLKGVKSDQELTRILPNVIDQMRVSLSRKLREMSNMSLTESHMKAIAYQLNRLPDPNQKVRRSVTARVQAYLFVALKTEGAAPVPDMLHFISRELVELSAKLNLVFVDSLGKCLVFYENILNGLSKKQEKREKEALKRQTQKHHHSKYIRANPYTFNHSPIHGLC